MRAAAAALVVLGVPGSAVAVAAGGGGSSRVPRDGRIEARTSEGRRVVLELRDGHVVLVRAGLQHYRCETFGEIGPLVVGLRGRARVARDGRFAFVAGVPAQTLRLSGRFSVGARTVSGSARVTGTIATGQRCASATVRYASAGASGRRLRAASMSASENSGSSMVPSR